MEEKKHSEQYAIDVLVGELRAMMGTLPANKQRELDQLLQRYEG